MDRRLTAKPIAIAADHRGFPLKERLKAWLRAHDYAVWDCGADSAAERVDALDYALALVAEIKHGRSDFAVGICGSGQMMAIVSNRFAFMRSALLHTASEAAPAREHGDANMLAFFYYIGTTPHPALGELRGYLALSRHTAWAVRDVHELDRWRERIESAGVRVSESIEKP